MPYTIWKFTIPFSDVFTIEMPEGSRLLSVQVQEVEPPKVSRGFRLHGTGHKVDPDIGPYVGTFQVRMATPVFHLFDQGESPLAGGA